MTLIFFPHRVSTPTPSPPQLVWGGKGPTTPPPHSRRVPPTPAHHSPKATRFDRIDQANLLGKPSLPSR